MLKKKKISNQHNFLKFQDIFKIPKALESAQTPPPKERNKFQENSNQNFSLGILLKTQKKSPKINQSSYHEKKRNTFR